MQSVPAVTSRIAPNISSMVGCDLQMKYDETAEGFRKSGACEGDA